uniref:BTB domain-containing protein n=1 Tax=Panagrolaimus sp. PS1159 TaxID=55785 RepID=A0AC35FAC3_9BILA
MDIHNNKLVCPIGIHWTIPEDCLKEKEDPGDCLHTKIVSASNIPDTKYYMKLYPNDDDDDKHGETWIYLFFVENGKVIKREAEYNIKIESANFVSDDNTLIEDRFYGTRICTIEELLDPEKGFIIDGKLTIKMDGFFMTEMKMLEELQSFGDHRDALCLSLWNQEIKDFTVAVDGNVITAHKCVLAARSPVFAKMFESGMKEAKENKVVIKDFSFDIVEKAIKLCYHQSLVPTTTLEEKIKLLQFFDKYDIQILKNDFEKYLISVINELTVCKLTNAALISNALKLKMKCTEFLRDCMNTKPICDFDLLDKDFAMNLLKTSFCHVLK